MAKRPNRKKSSPRATLPPTDASQFSIVQKGTEPFSNWEFGVSVVFFAIFAGYVSLFLWVDTQVGHRFGAYQALCLNLDFYWAFWTGSPSGTFHIFDRWPIVLGSLFHGLLAYGCGKLAVFGLIGDETGRSYEKLILAMGTGLALISTYTFLIGLLQLYHLKHLLVFPVLATSLAGFLWVPSFFRKSTQLPKPETSSEFDTNPEARHWTRYTIWISAPFIGFILLGSMVPPWEFDVREYHLQVPKEWFQSGGVSFLPHNIYGNMPLGTEIHALFAMLYSWGADDWWWGAIIGKTISGCFAPLNFAMVYFLGKRLFGTFAGISSAVLYISTPWTTANSIIGYNESAISFYLLGSGLIILIQLQSNQQESLRGRSFLLGIFLGAAMACKYTSLPFVVIPLLIIHIFLVFRQTSNRQAWQSLGITLFGICLLGGPWYAKNAMLTGNPTYPLLETVFKTTRTPAQIQQWSEAHSPPENENPFHHFRQSVHSLALSHKWLSPLVLPFVLLSFFSGRKTQTYSVIAILLWAFMTWWFFTHRLERFLFPFFPGLCLLAGAGCHWISLPRWKTSVSLLILAGCFFNFILASSRLTGDVRIFAPLSELDVRNVHAQDYQHPQDQIIPLQHLSPAVAWLNENHPSSKVLFFGECRPFAARFPVIYNTCFDTCETWKRLKGKSQTEIHTALNNENIDFILLNLPELKRLEGTYGYNVPHRNKQVNERLILSLEPNLLKRVTPPGVFKGGTILFQVMR